PMTFNPTSFNIAARKTILAHSTKIDNAIGAQTHVTTSDTLGEVDALRVCLKLAPLVATVGKSWVSSRAGGVVNYGWHGGSAAYGAVTKGLKVWQTMGRRHNADHYDYSQTLRLVKSQCTINGEKTTLSELLQDPGYCQFVTHEAHYAEDQSPWASTSTIH